MSDNKTKKAYTEILKVLKKYEDTTVFDIDTLENKAKNHLFGIELKEKYGLNIDPKKIESTSWQKFGSYKKIVHFRNKNQQISWSDDGRQPENEVLVEMSFPTGAYIFGGDYPTKYFDKFWEELKTYKPKYIDSQNHCIYFALENASEIFNEFETILRKYYDQNKEDYKKREIENMEKKLLELKNKQ